MPIYPYKQILPTIDPSAWISPTADIIGDVHIGEHSSCWYHTTIRGDVNHIRIGSYTNIQDGSTIHVTRKQYPTIIGNQVTIGHNVLLHGCTLGSLILVGMGSIIMDGATIQNNIIIGAGSLISQGQVLESGYLYFGRPAKQIRLLTISELEFLPTSADNYISLKNDYI